MNTPMIYNPGIGFTVGEISRAERSALTRGKTESVDIRGRSERESVSLPLLREAPRERYDYRKHLVENSDIVAAWAVAIGFLCILTAVV